MKKIGKINVNKLSIKRQTNSPIYGITTSGKISECFINALEPKIELNESIITVQEFSMSGFKHVTDEYDLLITYVKVFTIDDNDNFTLEFEGKRLNHVASIPIIEPTIADVLSYKTALLLVIAGDVNQIIVNDKLEPETPEARAYLSKMKTINHLGTIYYYNTALFTTIKTDMPNHPEDIRFIRSNMMLIYSSKEIPVKEDIETVKHIYHRKMFPKY